MKKRNSNVSEPLFALEGSLCLHRTSLEVPTTWIPMKMGNLLRLPLTYRLVPPGNRTHCYVTSTTTGNLRLHLWNLLDKRVRPLYLFHKRCVRATGTDIVQRLPCMTIVPRPHSVPTLYHGLQST